MLRATKINRRCSQDMDEWLLLTVLCGSNNSPITIIYVGLANLNSIESPSLADPQWNIWYWGSKWNLHTVCWGAVGCEWGTASVYFGVTFCLWYWAPVPISRFFVFVKSIIWRTNTKNPQKISCWLKIWMLFVGPILIKLWTSSIWGFR